MIDDEEEVETEVRTDAEGRRYGVLKSKVPLDKRVAYFAFDREAQEEAQRARYLNSMGALGVLEARAKADKLKSGVSSAQYEYALFISENPWAVANHPAAPKRRQWAILAFAAALVVCVIAAAALRPHPPLAGGSKAPAEVAVEEGAVHPGGGERRQIK
jgi:hypothetical protein